MDRKLKCAQAYLILVGFNNNGQLVADGEMGMHTAMALMDFQGANGLEETGVYDRQTFSYMHDNDPTFPAETSGSSVAIKHLQSALILLHFDDNGQLVADGEMGMHTAMALMVFVENSFTNEGFSIYIDRADEPDHSIDEDATTDDD